MNPISPQGVVNYRQEAMRSVQNPRTTIWKAARSETGAANP
jgi:hypothetical protein